MEENNVILKPDLGITVAEVRERGERFVAELASGLSVGGCPPFGGRGRGRKGNSARGGVSVGQAVGFGNGCGADSVVNLLNRIGVPACRVWGAEPPSGRDAMGCPRHRKVCGAIYPYGVSVAASATAQLFEMFAKVWFWPIFWADTSETQVRVVSLEYTQDPVFENGIGSGPLNPSALFGASGFYGFVPGLPAYDNKVPLVAELSNSDAATPRRFRGMFVGISIRN